MKQLNLEMLQGLSAVPIIGLFQSSALGFALAQHVVGNFEN